MTDTPYVTVIIPVKDDTERLDRCLAALRAQDFDRPFEIIVADNGSALSPESTVAKYDNATFLFEPTNGSYAARNAALPKAKGEILAFTDSDCLPQTTWLSAGVKNLEAAGEGTFVGGKVQLFAKNEARPTPGELWDQRQGFHQQRYIEEEKFSATANLFVRRHDFDKVGPFQQAFISSGDREWGNRATATGLKGVYAEDVLIKHPCRDSLKGLRKKNIRMFTGDIQLRRKNNRALLSAREVAIGVCPPIPTLVKNLGKLDPSTLRSKALYTWAALYITYTSLFDRLRIVAGERKA